MRAIERRLRDIEHRTYGANGSPVNPDLVALQRTMEALMDALGPYPLDELRVLLGRIDAGAVTETDGRMMDNLPKCYMAPVEIVRRMVEVQNMF